MIGAIVLGAGFSRRFGSDKRSYLISTDGAAPVPMLCATCALYASVFEVTLVVLRPEDSTLREALAEHAPGARPVLAGDAAQGMARSLAAGIRAAAGWRAAFVALGDMPFVGAATLAKLRETLMERLDEDLVLVPTHDGRDGHPVAFPASLFPRLGALTGDRGARGILDDPAVDVLRLPVADAGVLKDLDRPPQRSGSGP